jgi:ATP-binding cassette subfamily B protein
MSAMGGPGGGNWMQLRSYTRDRSVNEQKLQEGTVRRVVAYARPYRALVIALLINLALDAVLVVVQPLLIRYIIDTGVGSGNRSIVVTGALVLGVVGIIDTLLGISGRFFSSRIGEGLIFDLRTEVFRHVQDQSLAFFTRTQTGALVSRLNGDVLGAQQAFTSTLTNVVGNLVSLVALLVAMTALSWQITAVALALVPLFLVPARLIGGRIAGLTRDQFNLNAEMSTTMTERFNVAGATLVKLYGDVPTESRAFSAKAARVRDTGIRIALSNRIFFSMLSVVAAIATAFAYGFGGVSAIAGTLTVGTLLAIVSLLGRLYAPLTGLANVRVDVMTALVSFERVFEVLDLPSLVQDPQVTQAVPSGSLDIEFDHVTFRYPQASEVSLASLESIAKADTVAEHSEVLHDVSFCIPAGQLVALVGPSGAGKTTISTLVPRLYDVSEGAIRIGGVDVRELAQTDLHAAIGVVSQEAHLFHDTIAANLRYARPDASDADLIAALEQAQLGDLFATLTNGLNTVVGDRGHRLSGGEKQRMALARVFLKQPRIIVLDEATAHLDSESEVAVQRALTLALQGRTALVIAHRLSTIRNADAIVVLQDGAVVDIGTHSQLLERGGLYADLYTTQFSGDSEG